MKIKTDYLLNNKCCIPIQTWSWGS